MNQGEDNLQDKANRKIDARRLEALQAEDSGDGTDEELAMEEQSEDDELEIDEERKEDITEKREEEFRESESVG
jgi:hypothetical protein